MKNKYPDTIEIEHEVDAPADEVWQLLTTPGGLRQWFPLDARVEPGEDGSIWLSWGPGCEGEAPIHVWVPGERFGWTESYGENKAGQPIRLAVDFHVEGRGSTTVVRLVQSGFSSTDGWDEMYDALEDGWTFFMFSLLYYCRRHRGKTRTMAWKRVASDLSREVIWDKLTEAALIGVAGVAAGTSFDFDLAGRTQGETVSARAGHHFAATLPAYDDAVWFVELEGENTGFWLSTYDLDPARVDELQQALDTKLAAVLAPQ